MMATLTRPAVVVASRLPPGRARPDDPHDTDRGENGAPEALERAGATGPALRPVQARRLDASSLVVNACHGDTRSGPAPRSSGCCRSPRRPRRSRVVAGRSRPGRSWVRRPGRAACRARAPPPPGHPAAIAESLGIPLGTVNPRCATPSTACGTDPRGRHTARDLRRVGAGSTRRQDASIDRGRQGRGRGPRDVECHSAARRARVAGRRVELRPNPVEPYRQPLDDRGHAVAFAG